MGEEHFLVTCVQSVNAIIISWAIASVLLMLVILMQKSSRRITYLRVLEKFLFLGYAIYFIVWTIDRAQIIKSAATGSEVFVNAMYMYLISLSVNLTIVVAVFLLILMFELRYIQKSSMESPRELRSK